MRIKRIQIFLVSAVILASALFAHLLVPRKTMGLSSTSFDLQQVVPRQFGEWAVVPNIRLVEPPGPDTLARQLYSQELARGYRDREGHIVMLLVAYGPDQSNRLQLHRPEICYAAEGFRVSRSFRAEINYRVNTGPLKFTRLVAQREVRLEPITYWMRIGDDIATGVAERQIIKLKYGLRGILPDGALIRISTVGLPEQTAYQVQDRFIRDFLSALPPKELAFFVGSNTATF